MSHSSSNIWLHIIFSTKERSSLILSSFEEKLHQHIKNKLITEYDSFVEIINGTDNHIHILLKQSPNFAISDIIKNIKGESSHWINQNDFINRKFVWQTGYSVFSISINKVDTVRKYISNQKEHHKKTSFLEELSYFYKVYGLDEKLSEINQSDI
jgi:REP element-mobilizing transposase RayT